MVEGFRIFRIQQVNNFEKKFYFAKITKGCSSRLKLDYSALKITVNILNFLISFLSMKIGYQSLAFGLKNFKGQTNPQFKHINLRKDYYRTLEVQNDASMLTIRKSYMKLAKKLHPDVNPKGHLQFTQIQQAYNILCNGELRKYYDSNNVFYTPPQPKASTAEETLNNRDRHFYEHMRSKGFEDFQRDAYQKYQQEGEGQRDQRNKEEREETEEESAERRIREEIEFTRRMMFKRNPVWQEANSYMNYELRMQHELEKQKEFEALFMSGGKETSLIGKFKKWMFKS